MAKRIVLGQRPWYRMVEVYGMDARKRTCGLCRKWRSTNGMHWCEVCSEPQVSFWPEYASACRKFERSW